MTESGWEFLGTKKDPKIVAASQAKHFKLYTFHNYFPIYSKYQLSVPALITDLTRIFSDLHLDKVYCKLLRFWVNYDLIKMTGELFLVLHYASKNYACIHIFYNCLKIKIFLSA